MTVEERDKAKSTRQRYLVLLSAILVVFLVAYFVGKYGLPFGSHLSNTQRQAETTNAQEKWAEPIELPGLPNFHKVSDDVYRGAQPTAEGIRQLEKIGIKTVVNLRSSHSDNDELQGSSLAYEHIEMTAWGKPENDEVLRFLQIVSDSNSLPVFVHCQHGADRTGIMCAVYRIIIQGWGKDEAIEEMTKGGFGFHRIRRSLPDYIHRLDVQEIKGLKIENAAR